MRSRGVERPNTRVFQLKEMADKAQNIVKLNTVKLIQKLLSRKGIRATVRGLAFMRKNIKLESTESQCISP